MNAKELAIKICQHEELPWGDHEHNSLDWIESLLSEALLHVADKRVDEAMKAAYLDAAKIAENEISNKQSGSLWSRACRRIADKLRQRASE